MPTNKFANLSREEVEAMLGLKLEETRVYREAKAEGREEEREKVIRNLLHRGLNLEAIAEITELTVEEVQQIIQQIS
jgi:predicted transposase YdaD